MYGRSQDSSSVDGRYRYTGKERDAETKYDYFGARYYDARIGRFLSVDPLSDDERLIGWSPYHYGYNSPIVYIDPNGMRPQLEEDESLLGTFRRILGSFIDRFSPSNDESIKHSSHQSPVQTISEGEIVARGIEQLNKNVEQTVENLPEVGVNVGAAAGAELDKRVKASVMGYGTITTKFDISSTLKGNITLADQELAQFTGTYNFTNKTGQITGGSVISGGATTGGEGLVSASVGFKSGIYGFRYTQTINPNTGATKHQLNVIIKGALLGVSVKR